LTPYQGYYPHRLSGFGDDDLLESAENYIEAYREVQDKLDKKYREIQDVSSEGSSKLLSDFLLFDTVILEYEDDRELVPPHSTRFTSGSTPNWHGR